MINKNLIFDIGLHKGLDAEFYLAKGFQVVEIEAVETLAETARVRNELAVNEGRLTIVNRALWLRSDDSVKFYVNPEKDDWGSLFRGAAEKGVGAAQEITVETISLSDLFAKFGVPYYAKCDIEGGDAIFVQLLLESGARPPFISVELTSLRDAAFLVAAGYDRFQIVNQALNFATVPPNPSREGVHVDMRFGGEQSGLFGFDLPHDKWRDFDEVCYSFSTWRKLSDLDRNLGVGWLDIHATRQETLASGTV